METLEAFRDAALVLVTGPYWIALFAGVFLSIAVGLIPGVGSLLVMALILPFLLIRVDDPAIAIVMLAAITGCNNTLDSIPAVLVGLPSGSTQVTFLEGNQLARQGYGAHTLGAVYVVSAIGGLVGAVVLFAVVPIIKPFVLQFSYSEIAVTATFGVAMVAILSRGAMIKGVAAAMFGLLISTVGTEPFTGTARYTFGRVEMWGGLPTIATLLGIFAIPELVDLTMTRKGVAPAGANVSRREVFRGARDGLKRWKVAVRQSLFGVALGAIPGVGAGVIDWLSYALGSVLNKDPEIKERLGKGSLDGVLWAEGAQNAKEAGQGIPTLALGVPGGTGWIMILVAMMAYGITPGAGMLDRHADITMLIVITLGLGNLIVTIIGLFVTGYVAHLTRIPYPIIGFAIMPMAVLAAFTDMLSWFAIPIILVFGAIGLFMKRFGWPRPPLVLGFILGPIIDQNFQTALGFHGLTGILTRPITIILLILLVVFTVGLLKAASRAEEKTAAPAGGSDTDPARAEPHSGPQRSRFTWKNEMIGPLVVMGGTAAFLIASLDYPARARYLPMWLSIGIIVLAGAQFLMQGFATRAQGQIMDIGMRSVGAEGARMAALVIAALFALFLFLSVLIGLQYSSIVFAFLGPVLLLQGRVRWIGGAASAIAVSLFTIVLMDEIMHIIWPQPVLWNWITGG